MTSQMGVTSALPSEGVGLSDESEDRIWAQSMGVEGVGDPVEFQRDIATLGL